MVLLGYLAVATTGTFTPLAELNLPRLLRCRTRAEVRSVGLPGKFGSATSIKGLDGKLTSYFDAVPIKGLGLLELNYSGPAAKKNGQKATVPDSSLLFNGWCALNLEFEARPRTIVEALRRLKVAPETFKPATVQKYGRSPWGRRDIPGATEPLEVGDGADGFLQVLPLSMTSKTPEDAPPLVLPKTETSSTSQPRLMDLPKLIKSRRKAVESVFGKPTAVQKNRDHTNTAYRNLNVRSATLRSIRGSYTPKGEVISLSFIYRPADAKDWRAIIGQFGFSVRNGAGLDPNLQAEPMMSTVVDLKELPTGKVHVSRVVDPKINRVTGETAVIVLYR